MLRTLVVAVIFAAAVASAALLLLAVDRSPASAQAGNTPPVIVMDRFRREYKAPNNANITVDVRNIAEDREDRPSDLEWFVDAKTLDHAQFGYASPDLKQILVFEPEPGFIGSDMVLFDVVDTGGLKATAAITLTWKIELALPMITHHIRIR